MAVKKIVVFLLLFMSPVTLIAKQPKSKGKCYSAKNSTGVTHYFSANYKAYLEQKNRVTVAFGPITIGVKFYFWFERESMQRAT